MAEIIDTLEIAFHEHGLGHVEMPPKPGVHSRPDAFIHAMPAYIPALHAIGVKWLSAYPANQERGLPYITGLLVINDDETGLPLAVMDCTWITGMRTGAATALAAKYLARPDSATVGILGCGVQGRTNLEALKTLFPVKRVIAYDGKPENAGRYAQEMRARFDLDVTVVSDPCQAVSGCDMVVTAGFIRKVPHTTIKPGWPDTGAFASLVDYDSYWAGAAMKEAASSDRRLATAPVLSQHRSLPGYPTGIRQLGELVTGRKPGRQSPTERTMTCNLGLALDDMATAPIIYRRVVDAGWGPGCRCRLRLRLRLSRAG